MAGSQLRTATKRSVVFFAVLAAIILTTQIGCGKDNDPVKPLPSKYFPQSSLTNAVRNLRQAYLDRNPQEYRKLFASDFRYVFSSPLNHPCPPIWDYDADCAATESLFVAVSVDRIDVNFDMSEETASSLFPGCTKVFAQNVRLIVDARAADSSAVTLATPGDETVTFFGIQDSLGARASDGKPLWRIWRWEDQPVEGAGMRIRAEVRSWGSIKCLFASPLVQKEIGQ